MLVLGLWKFGDSIVGRTFRDLYWEWDYKRCGAGVLVLWMISRRHCGGVGELVCDWKGEELFGRAEDLWDENF